MRKLTVQQIAREYYDLFNTRRFEEAELLVSTHAAFHYPHTRETLIGRAGYRELTRLWLLAFPDAELSIVQIAARESHTVTVDLVGRGTHTGPLTFGGPLALEPTGRHGELPFNDTLHVEGGEIVESWLRFDIEQMVRQLKNGRRP